MPLSSAISFSVVGKCLSLTNNNLAKEFNEPYGLLGWRGEGGRVGGSRVKLAKNKLILG